MNMKRFLIGKTNPACFLLASLGWLSCSSAAFGTNTLTPLTNAIVCPGETRTFRTVASGPTPYQFQWWTNGIVIPGQTSNSLTLPNVIAANAATYSVTLKGGANNVTNSATLTVRTNVTATPLSDLVRSVGGIAIFSTTASGTGPFSYAWKTNGTVLPGRTASSLTLTNLSPGDSGTYSVVVSGACTSVTNSASLTVDSCFPAVDVMLVIDRSGSMAGQKYTDAKQACSNFVQNLHFSTNADQAGLASYNSTATLDQKLTNNVQILNQAIHSLPGANGSTSISSGLQTAQTELVSSRHNPQALPVLVLLTDGLPTGSDTPSNALYAASQAKNAGTRIFTVGLGADADPVLLQGIASSPGDFYFTTNSAQLTALFNAISTVICRPPTNIIGPTNLTVCAGSTARFSVSASGCAAFSYQWEKGGVRIPGQTNSSLVLPNVPVGPPVLYAVEVISACRSVTNSAYLTVTPPPTINCSADKTVEAGLPWTFDAPTNNGVIVLRMVTNLTGQCTFIATWTWQATNSCGNSAPCSQTVTVVDTTKPSITCPAPVNVQCFGNIPAPDLNAVNASDNCGNPAKSFVGDTYATNGCIITVSRTYKATDASGNSATCTQTITVQDTTPPSITCPPATTVQCFGDIPAPNLDAVSASDNCGTPARSFVGDSYSTNGNIITVTRTYKATDACSNSTICTQTITVQDTTPPLVSCPAAATVQCFGDIPAPNPNSVNASDNCGAVTNRFVGDSYATNGCVITVTRTYQTMDRSSNSATCTQTITVQDTTPPSITCPPATTVQGFGNIPAPDPTAVSATDNCGTPSKSFLGDTYATNGCTITVTRAWQATDACGNSNQCSQTITVHDTTPPTVNIFTPTDGTVFIAPATFRVSADAHDANGIATVEFFLDTASAGVVSSGPPYSISLTNVAVGPHTLTAKATDSCGNMATSASVNITVLAHAPLSIVSGIRFNPRTGLYEETVRVSNPTQSSSDAVRVYVNGLTAAQHLHNASGVTNGVPFAQSMLAVAAGSFLDMTLEYHVTDSSVPNPTPLIAELVMPSDGGSTASPGDPQHINRILKLANNNIMIEFASLSNRVYEIQYSRDLQTPWNRAQPTLVGNGTWIQWVDNGPPKTESAPAQDPSRVYRVLLLH